MSEFAARGVATAAVRVAVMGPICGEVVTGSSAVCGRGMGSVRRRQIPSTVGSGVDTALTARVDDELHCRLNSRLHSKISRRPLFLVDTETFAAFERLLKVV